jgi:hypothetical protein
MAFARIIISIGEKMGNIFLYETMKKVHIGCSGYCQAGC